MIQRIQTVYLFLAALSALMLFVLPIGEIMPDPSTGIFVPLKASFSLPLSILVGLSAASAFGAIVLYQNRPLQARIAYGSLVLVLLSALYAAYLLFTSLGYTLGVGLLLPLLAANLLVLAIRAIRKDEETVRSADRLR